MISLLAADLPLGNKPISGAGPIGEGSQYLNGAESAATAFQTQLSNIIGFVTLIGGLFFLINFFLAAFEWLRAGEDKGTVEKAQKKMTNAAIGLFIMVIATGIVGIVGGVFGLDILRPVGIFKSLVPKGTL